MPLPTRARAGLVAAALLAGGLFLAPPAALGQTDPAAPRCSDFGTQAQAQVAFNAHPKDSTYDGLDVAADGKADGVVCQDYPFGAGTTVTLSPAPTTTTTTAAPPDTTVEDAVNAVVAQIDALQCGPDLGRDQGAVEDALLALPTNLSLQTVGDLEDRLVARLDALNYCFDTVASTSGDQVSVIPVGSAETGGA